MASVFGGKPVVQKIAFVFCGAFGWTAALALEVDKPVDFTAVQGGVGYALTVNQGPLIIEKIWREIYLRGELVAQEEIRLPAEVYGRALNPSNPEDRLKRELDQPRLQKQEPTKQLKQKPDLQQQRQLDLRKATPTQQRADAFVPNEGLPEDQKGLVVATIPLDAEAFRKLKDDYYGQKLIISAKWDIPGNTPFRTQRWTHVVVQKGRPRPISSVEYSNAVDKPVQGLGDDGRPALLNLGIDGPQLGPLNPTKESEDVGVKLDPKQTEWMLRDQKDESDER